jgi:hypothetical protein
MSIDSDGLSPAEERLVALLEVLREEGIEPGDALADAVMRAVEWQIFVRGTILLLSDLVGSMAGMLSLFFAARPGTARDEA